ncbi:MAG: glycosyl hydrolase [Terriglobia bacterium]|jgi:hypothetical protein
MIRRISLFLILALISLIPVGNRFSATQPEVRASLSSGGGQAQGGGLYAGFLDPPREYSTMPFWFWNGKMEGPKIQEEIRRMVDQHVYGAFLHARDGLETPYHSEEWWQGIGAGLEQAKRSGFEFNFVDEYDWPSGEARNIWMAGNHQSEVLARKPEYRMRSLSYKAEVVKGPREVTIAAPPELQAVVAARWLGENRIDGQSLQLLAAPAESGQVKWQAGDGDWVIVEFYLEPSMGFDGGFVDLMNPLAMKSFFDLAYGEFHRRFGAYFGSTIHYSFADHEGDYGYRIAWTPALFDAFTKRTGYDLHKVLPLLIYNGGDSTTKVRCDYLATVTQLYQESFWKGITDGAAEFGIGRTGHAWEESLQWAAALEGSLFAVERGLNPVGVDSLVDFGRQPLNFKVAQSVADFEGRRFMCENQGVQGTDSYLDMEGLRRGTNGIGLWGVNLFVGHAFNYDASRANYPPDWLHQPYWSYFHYYADYTRRISYMNSESRHAANVLLYYPILSMWAHSDPVFSGSAPYNQIETPAVWKNLTITVNDYYTRLILRLADRQWDYNIADDSYLAAARVEGKELVIGPQRFHAIILPPISTIGRSSLDKIHEFYEAGGEVLGIRMLPTSSPEAGDNDAEVIEGIDALFGAKASETPTAFTEQQGAAGGHAYFVSHDVETLIDLLDSNVPKDVRVISGSSGSLYFEHREKMGRNYYWVVNDSDRPRTNQILLATAGIPEKWDALSGKRSPLFYVNRPQGTEARLDFAPWDAYYVVFNPLEGQGQKAELVSTNAESVVLVSRQPDAIQARVSAHATQPDLEVTMRADGQIYRARSPIPHLDPISLSGNWRFRPEPERVEVPYVKVKDAPEGEGEKLGWSSPTFDDTAWPSQWLSEAENTVRNWIVVGPFPNTDDAGFDTAYPPEAEFKPEKMYAGLNGDLVGWKRYYGDEPYLTLGHWNIWMLTEGGPFDDSAHIVQFNRALDTAGHEWITSYALTYLFSPQNQQADFVIAADNCVKVWLNHQQVFARLRHPFWYEMNDNWADRIPVDLRAGWNEVLLKVGEGRGAASGYYGFTFRVADREGRTLRGIINGMLPYDVQKAASTIPPRRWYRTQIPPGITAVAPPAFHGPYRLILNGVELKPSGGSPVDIRPLRRTDKNTLAIVARADDRLSSPVEFVSGTTPFALVSWTKTPLANFSGAAIYEKSVLVPDSYQGKKLILDLGRVSSVAEVYVNGRPAGTLVWRPYKLDITEFIKPGENQLKIRVTNTEANARAVGPSHRILANIDVCGLEGPVEIVPYTEQTLVLKSEKK